MGLLAVFVNLAMVACGGPERLSEQAYFRAVEEIAAGTEADSARVWGRLDDAGEADAKSTAMFLADLRSVTVDLRGQLVDLRAPRALAGAHQALLAAVDGLIMQLEQSRSEGHDFDTFANESAPARAAVGRACIALEQHAEQRGAPITLACANVQED